MTSHDAILAASSNALSTMLLRLVSLSTAYFCFCSGVRETSVLYDLLVTIRLVIGFLLDFILTEIAVTRRHCYETAFDPLLSLRILLLRTGIS